jgi:hypothetical protein
MLGGNEKRHKKPQYSQCPTHRSCSLRASPLEPLFYFILLIDWGWGDTESTLWTIVSVPDDRWWWMWCSRWKPKYSEKTCLSATLSATNPIWPDLGPNAGRRRRRLNYGNAFLLFYLTKSTESGVTEIMHCPIGTVGTWNEVALALNSGLKRHFLLFLLMFASCCVCITNNSMSFLPSTQHLFNSHYMFRPQKEHTRTVTRLNGKNNMELAPRKWMPEQIISHQEPYVWL